MHNCRRAGSHIPKKDIALTMYTTSFNCSVNFSVYMTRCRISDQYGVVKLKGGPGSIAIATDDPQGWGLGTRLPVRYTSSGLHGSSA